MTHSPHLDRRGFLRRGGALAAGGIAGPWMMNLAAMAQAAAAQAPGDYKALVCVFLVGGNDHANTLIPYDEASHARYVAARPNLALARSALQATALAPSVPLPGDRQMALAPSLSALKPFFDDGRLAALLNIGPLLGPTTLADVAARRRLPPKLFSHNDQQAVWQSFQPEGALSGWGGLIGEQGLPVATARLPRDNLASINLAGNAVFLNGLTSRQYMVNPLGIKPLNSDTRDYFGVPNLSEAFRALSVEVPSDGHWMARQHADVVQRARRTNEVLRAALDASAGMVAPLPMPTSVVDYDQRRLALQLNMAARLIQARTRLGLTRQVFFAAIGSFDHHDNLSAKHPELLRRVGEALAAFQANIDAMNLGSQVTVFTASDFGRTMTSNGDGSDHGWGAHHFVLGGAVRGGRFHGELPEVLGGATDVGQGRLLPTTSVDHLSAALARWMDVPDSAIGRIAPNLSRWNGVDPLASLMRG